MEKFYYDILLEQAKAVPDREAIIMGETRLTYSQLISKIDSVAAALLRMGLKRATRSRFGQLRRLPGFTHTTELYARVVLRLFLMPILR